jgi:hypothetical protein
MIENSQVSIGMKYFVIEHFNKGTMGYDVGTALDEEGLIKQLCDCTRTMEEYNFKLLVGDIVKETPKFCYQYDNIWKYVLVRKYRFEKTVTDVEKALNDDINAYHSCKPYDLLAKADRDWFEKNRPEKETKSCWNGKMYPTKEYAHLNDLLWEWFNSLTKGKYELLNDVLYNKAKKAEEKLSVLKYKELSDEDKAEVSKFVESQLDERGWYHNTGYVDATTADGRKLGISDVDTLELAISIDTPIHLVGDYICGANFDVNKLFKGASFITNNPVHYEPIGRDYRNALKLMNYDKNRFYEYNTPYGRFGYDIYDVSDKVWNKNIGRTMFITKVNDKSIQFITTDSFDLKEALNEDNIEKRKLETELKNGSCSESFTFFKKITPNNRTKFTPEALMKDARDKAKKYYEDAVKRFGEPIVEQKTSEQELVAAASEAL